MSVEYVGNIPVVLADRPGYKRQPVHIETPPLWQIRSRYRNAKVLASQLCRFDGRNATGTDILERFIKPEPDTLPFLVQQTASAILVYGTPEKMTRPNIFTDNIITSTPNYEDLQHWSLTEEDVTQALQQPGILAGSAIITYYDGIDENEMWMRKVESGPYAGRWTVGGGHYDTYSEVAAIAELNEEADIQNAHWITPVGTADQAVAIQHGNEVKLTRYVSLMWEVTIPYGVRPNDYEHFRAWQKFTDIETGHMLYNKQLTPIAECAVRSNFLFR